MTKAEIEALLERHKEAFRQGDADALAGCHTEGGTFESPAAGLVTGRSAIRGVYDYWLDAFPDLQFVWGEPLIDGDRIGLFWHFSGTVSGKFFGSVKQGTRIEFDGAGEYHVSPKGIVSVKHVFDFTGALVNAGVLKVKPE